MVFILIAILLILVIIALAVMFWYVSIPLIILFAVYHNRQKIRDYLQARRTVKSQQNYHSSSKTGKPFGHSNPTPQEEPENEYSEPNEEFGEIGDFLNEMKISDDDAEEMLGRDWQALTSIDTLYDRMITIGEDRERLVRMHKHLIRKFSILFERTHKIIVESEPDTDYLEPTFKEIQENCKFCYENYAKSKYEQSQNYYKKKPSSEKTTSSSGKNKTKSKEKKNYKRTDSNHENTNKSYSGTAGNYNSTEDDYKRFKENASKNSNSSRGRRSGKKSQIRERRIQSRLSEFGITENEAEIIFGKRWRTVLGKLNFQLYYEIKIIQIYIFYRDPKYLAKIRNLYDKVIKIIELVISQNPDLEEENSDNFNTKGGYSYDYSYNYSKQQENQSYDADDSQEDEQSYDTGDSENDYEQNPDNVSKAYRILGIDPSATMEQIKKRFRELVKQYHPDRNKSPDATARTREIIESYELILTSRGQAA